MEINNYINKIINGDCLEVMKEIPSNSVDLILTDPPYGDGTGYGRYNKTILSNETPDINKHIMPYLYRLLKNDRTFYCFTNWKFAYLVRDYAESVGFTTKMLCVIVKNNIGMGSTFRNQYELCWVFEKGTPTYNKQISNVLRMEYIHHDETTHPHQKGMNIITQLIDITDAELVLDCFSGSGTTAIACHELKRNFICIEKDINYYNMSQKRYINKKSQLTLF